MSLHPPHLIDSSGSLTPSALIPFCAYQSNMTLLGQARPDLNFTVCSKLKPTVLEGQLCYSLDLRGIQKTKVGQNFGLLLILDPGSIDNEDVKERKVSHGSEIVSLDLQPVGAASSSAKIYLHTLESFTDYRAGTYALSVLKKMTGTQSFMKLSNKPCQLEISEECEMKRYIKEVQKQCGCVPWALSSALSLQVAPAVSKVFPLLPRTNFSVHPTPLPATQQSPKALQLVMSPALDSTQMWSSKRTQFLLMTK